MKALCIGCGRYQHAERHHVARRLHPQNTPCKPHCVTVNACVPCHQILTIWDSERSWPASRMKVQPYSAQWGDRLVAGVLDIFRLDALRMDLPNRMTEVADMIDANRRAFRYTVRPSRVFPDVPVTMPDDIPAQTEMLDALVNEVFTKARVRASIAMLRKVG